MIGKTNKTSKAKSKEEIAQQIKVKTANQWMPVADIDGNIVYRKDGLLLGMLRVQPLNIDLFSDNEKKSKVDTLAEELNGESDGLQIFCIGRPVDLNSYLEWLQEKAKLEQDYIRRKVLKSYLKEASYIASSGETIERRFYIIITKTAVEGAEEELQNKLSELKTKLNSAELISHICTDDELTDVYSLFAHPAQAAFERSTIDISLSPLLED